MTSSPIIDAGRSAIGPRPAPRTIVDLEAAGLIIEDEGRTRLGDEFRIAASRLHSAIKASILSGERNGNTLLVTSTKPAEGKSFSALNLAASLAQTAQRPVVLVDADLKPGSVSASWSGSSASRGCSTWSPTAPSSPASSWWQPRCLGCRSCRSACRPSRRIWITAAARWSR